MKKENIVDFSSLPTRNKFFGGANGNKISVYYNHKWYMLKFQTKASKNPNMSYANSHITEHIGCEIFKSVGIEAQNTIVGTYKKKYAVLCEDFETDNWHFNSFQNFSNSIVCEKKGFGINDVLNVIKTQNALPQGLLLKRFWDMFIVDALIGNPDRHGGNWGFLCNETTNEIKLAPIFDCGSSLYPQADEETMKVVMTNENELNIRIYQRNNSVFSTEENKSKHIQYLDFLSNTDNIQCLNSFKTIYKRINLDKINKIIDNTPTMTNLHKTYLRFMLQKRKELILDKAYEKHFGKGIDFPSISR